MLIEEIRLGMEEWENVLAAPWLRFHISDINLPMRDKIALCSKMPKPMMQTLPKLSTKPIPKRPLQGRDTTR